MEMEETDLHYRYLIRQSTTRTTACRVNGGEQQQQQHKTDGAAASGALAQRLTKYTVEASNSYSGLGSSVGPAQPGARVWGIEGQNPMVLPLLFPCILA